MVNGEGGLLYGTLKFKIEFVSRLQKKESSLGERPEICIRRIRRLCKQTVQLIKLYLNDTISESGIQENRMYQSIERTEEGNRRPLPTLQQGSFCNGSRAKGLWTISSTCGHFLQTQNWNKEGNNTEVDILNINCIKQEGTEKNYHLKPYRAKCIHTEF